MEAYEEIKYIDRGAYSTVYKAQRVDDKRPVVLKKIELSRFESFDLDLMAPETDCQLASACPYVVELYDTLVVDNIKYIVMEYCTENNLHKLMRRRKAAKSSFSEDEIVRLAYQSLRALEVVHSKNIVHRDIKPENIFLTIDKAVAATTDALTPPLLKAKLGDFGLSVQIKPGTVLEGVFVGSPFYMSPELILGEDYGTSVDIWALGCIIYELATLVPLFNANEKEAIQRLIVEGDIPSLPRREFSSDFNLLFLSMVDRDSFRRPSATALLRLSIFEALCAEDGYEPKRPTNVLGKGASGRAGTLHKTGKSLLVIPSRGGLLSAQQRKHNGHASSSSTPPSSSTDRKKSTVLTRIVRHAGGVSGSSSSKLCSGTSEPGGGGGTRKGRSPTLDSLELPKDSHSEAEKPIRVKTRKSSRENTHSVPKLSGVRSKVSKVSTPGSLRRTVGMGGTRTTSPAAVLGGSARTKGNTATSRAPGKTRS